MNKTLARARILFDKGSRDSILDFLQEIDPNGTWTDKVSIEDGLEPLTYDEALVDLQDIINELELELDETLVTTAQ